MRGTLCPLIEMSTPSRITPAYAGNTFVCTAWLDYGGDHPRVCGEHLFYAEQSARIDGSPPRMRGTRQKTHGPVRGKRITPAYAGNTVVIDCYIQPVEDHPRVCGEHTITSLFST